MPWIFPPNLCWKIATLLLEYNVDVFSEFELCFAQKNNEAIPKEMLYSAVFHGFFLSKESHILIPKYYSN